MAQQDAPNHSTPQLTGQPCLGLALTPTCICSGSAKDSHRTCDLRPAINRTGTATRFDTDRETMRLINIRTLQLTSFDEAPPYAILSHRWTDHEMTFERFMKQTQRPSSPLAEPPHRPGPGFTKIERFCKLLRKPSFYSSMSLEAVEWCWVDTCCIDKRSSAELSEAVNSMARWYSNARVCVAYLGDVLNHDAQTDGQEAQLCKSTWFTRGWTLQELLFSSHMMFYDRDWNFIPGFNKRTRSGALALSLICGVPEHCLLAGQSVYKESVADRMSWAARRSTTRPEDEAYCLLGLFNINMPLLYGEGSSRAFFRLQKEIIERYDDETLFAWLDRKPAPDGPQREIMPILAAHPSWFVKKTRLSTHPAPFAAHSPYRITNRGLAIVSAAVEFSDIPPLNGEKALSLVGREVLVLQLNCYAHFASPSKSSSDSGSRQAVMICLRRLLSSTNGPTFYARTFCWTTGAALWERLTDYTVKAPHIGVRRIAPKTYYIATSWEQIQTLGPLLVNRADAKHSDIPTLDNFFEDKYS